MPITQEANNEIAPYNYTNYYSDEYYRDVFEVWYRNGKPSPKRLYQMLDPDPHTGHMPTEKILHEWINYVDTPFKLRAAEYDQEVANNLKLSAVGEKVEMHRRHADMGKQLASMGIEFLLEYGIDDPKTAVQAIVKGTDLERQSRGIDKILQAISDMSDTDLDDALRDAIKSVRVIDDSIDGLLAEVVDDENEP